MPKTETETEKNIRRWAAEIKREAEHWEQLQKFGGSDPHWEDGCGMNLTRNHIISYKRQIKEICEAEGANLPEEYNIETPPEVDNRYMARADEIRKNAKKTLKVYEQDADYRYLLQIEAETDEATKKSSCLLAVLGYVERLKDNIERGNILEMRRHEKPDVYIRAFRECREKIQGEAEKPVQKTELRQLTIFDFIAG